MLIIVLCLYPTKTHKCFLTSFALEQRCYVPNQSCVFVAPYSPLELNGVAAEHCNAPKQQGLYRIPSYSSIQLSSKVMWPNTVLLLVQENCKVAALRYLANAFCYMQSQTWQQHDTHICACQ